MKITPSTVYNPLPGEHSHSMVKKIPFAVENKFLPLANEHYPSPRRTLSHFGELCGKNSLSLDNIVFIP